jgi:ankyrin repeat protein
MQRKRIIKDLIKSVIDNKDYKTLQKILKNGADPDGTDEYTPIVHATNLGEKRIVELLLENGAKPDKCNYVYNQWEETFILEKPSIMIASEMGYIDIVKILLDHKADIDYITDPYIYDVDWDGEYGGIVFEEGSNPLMKACINGHKNIVKLLLQRGVEEIESNYNECHEQDHSCEEMSIIELCPDIVNIERELKREAGLHASHWLTRRTGRPFSEIARQIAEY